MINSRIIEKDHLAKLRAIILDDESLPYGVSRKFNRFFEGATMVIFDREGQMAVAKKDFSDDYEIDFSSREYMKLALYFGAALQKLDDSSK